MKILLIKPPALIPKDWTGLTGIVPPLGLAYVAAVLEQNGHEVKILDAVALNLTKTEVAREIKDFHPGLVGITAMTASFKGALEAAQIAHESNAFVVIGGPHMAAYPRETLSYSYIDFGIVGEGEYPMAELIKALEHGSPLADIKGLVYRKGEEIIVNGSYIVDDLEALAFPARELLPNEKYSSIIGLHPVTTMITSRGCPYHCAFCAKQPSDEKYRARSAANVADEMEMVIEKYGVREIMFYDDTMTVKRQHIDSICNEIIKRGLKVNWETPIRINEVDESLLSLMKKAGCLRLRYGIESGDPQILKNMNKNISLDMAKEVFRLTRKAGIETFAYFMVGYLHETAQTMTNTLRLAKELDPDLVMFTVTVPYPNTPLYEQVRKEGLIIDSDYWQEFTLGKRNDKIPYLAPDADKWLKKCYWSFYLRPGYILKSIAKIHSWDSVIKHFQALSGLLEWKTR